MLIKKSLSVGCFCIRSSSPVAIWMRKESEVHLDAAIEVNEIHTPVSRSFVRPKATSPSLPACLSVCCLSLWNIKEMKTLHILYMQQLTQEMRAASMPAWPLEFLLTVYR